METVRQAVSDIIHELRSYNLDDRFSFRFLAHKLRDNISTFLKQDAELRFLFNINELWKPLPSVKLKDSGYGVSSELYSDWNILKKSIKKIPSTYTGKVGNFIKVLNLNNSNEYVQIKSFEYKDKKNREYINKKIKYFWIEDGHLFIPDTDIEEVRVLGLFMDSQEADMFNEECNECYKPLDSILLVPKYILDLSKKQTVTELAQLSKRMIVDEKPNENQNQK